MDEMIRILAAELGKEPKHIENVVQLLDEGNTIPFIARYRKELHGAMDDTALRALEDPATHTCAACRSAGTTVHAAIDGPGQADPGARTAAIDAAVSTLAELEDLYRPYKQKRRTRATIAREKGLEPLANLLFAQKSGTPDPMEAAKDYVDPEKGVNTPEEALQGRQRHHRRARSATDAALRKTAPSGGAAAREDLQPTDRRRRTPSIACTTISPSPSARMQGHQVLAVNRGEKEKFLKVSLELDHDTAMQTVYLLQREGPVPGRTNFIRSAAEDAYDRLIFPVVGARRSARMLTDSACEGAIGQFALNLRPLLMQPPVKGKVTMGLDPGYRNGCKVAVVDGTGKVLDTAVVYPTLQ